MNDMKTNWELKLPPYEVGKDRFSYRDVKKDENGWADAELYYPFQYDLVCVKTQDKAKKGWWDGYQWEGAHLTSEDKVIAWKLNAGEANG